MKSEESKGENVFGEWSDKILHGMHHGNESPKVPIWDGMEVDAVPFLTGVHEYLDRFATWEEMQGVIEQIEEKVRFLNEEEDRKLIAVLQLTKEQAQIRLKKMSQ